MRYCSEEDPMRPIAPLLAFLALATAALATAGPATAEPPPAPPPPHPPALAGTIQVTGEGRVSSAPDVAVISIGVDAVAKTLSQATADANERMRRVLQAMEKNGVAPRDVRTTRYDVSIERPWKEGRPGPITSYTVSTAAEATVRDLGRLGTILDAATAAGSNAVGGLRMEKNDPTADRARALAAAYASARAKAEAIAKAAGVSLGDLVSVAESSAERIPVPLLAAGVMRAEAASAAPVAQGELRFEASVSAVFAIR
jgi:uncharacterized protein